MGVAGAIRAGRAYVEVFMEQNTLNRSLQTTSARLRSWSASLSSLGAKGYGSALPGPLAAMLNFSFSPAGIVAGMMVAAKSWAHGGAEMAHLAERAGTSVEALSTLAYAAKRTGVDTDRLAVGIRKMQVTIAAAARGMPQAGKAIASVGGNLQDLAGMTPEEQLRYLADRIAAIPNPTERAAAAVRLFGRSGTDMLPMLMEGADGIGRFEQRARDLGLVMSTDSAESALHFHRAIDDLQSVLKKCVVVIGSALGPYLEELTNWIITAAVKVRQWIGDNKGLILCIFKVAGAIVVASAGLSLFGRILGMLAGGIGMVTGIFTILSGVASVVGMVISGAWAGIVAIFGAVASAIAFLLTPMGMVVAVIVGIAGYFIYSSGIIGEALDFLSGVFSDLAADAMAAFGAIGDALAAGDIALAAKVLWSLLKMEWVKGINYLTEAWIGVKEIFMTAWTATVYGIARVALQAWGLIQSGWSALCTGLGAAWYIFCDLVRSAWSSVSGWFQKAWISLQESVGYIDAEEADTARTAVDAEIASSKKQQAAEQEARMAAIGQADLDRQAQIDQQTKGGTMALDATQKAETDARHAAYAQQMQDSQAEVDAAKQEFESLRGQAKTAREEAERKKPEGHKPTFTPMDLSAMPGAKATTVGTFSAAAVGGMGYGGGVFQEMKNGIDRIGNNGEEILDAINNGGTW